MTAERYYLKPLRAMGQNDAREARPNLYYAMIAPDGSDVFPVRTDGSDGKLAMEQTEKLPKTLPV